MKKNHHLKGFTLLELVVTIAVLGLLIPVMLGLTIKFTEITIKWQKFIRLKTESFATVEKIKHLIKTDVVDIYSCSNSVIPTYAPSIQFSDRNLANHQLTFDQNSGKFQIDEKSLHSSEIKFAGKTGIACLEKDDDFFDEKNQIVRFVFDVESSSKSNQYPIPTIHIQTAVKLRRY